MSAFTRPATFKDIPENMGAMLRVGDRIHVEGLKFFVGRTHEGYAGYSVWHWYNWIEYGIRWVLWVIGGCRS